MKWEYYSPKFIYEETFKDFGWPWAGHKRFAYDLIRNIKPRVIVELGTHKGTSLWSFCQAVKDGKMDSKIFAVDTWRGEKHAGFYGEEIFEGVKEIKNGYYSDLEITLLRKTFDEAVSDFEDKSIDLLHIDGLHTYEAVKHDFGNWILKVKDNGAVMIHDTFVSKDDFGVYKFWEEQKKNYKSIEFFHSFGLGIIFLDENKYLDLISLEREMQRKYSFLSEDGKCSKINSDFDIIYNKNKEVVRLNKIVERKDDAIKRKDQIIQNQEQELRNIRSSLQWKIPNYFFKRYKKYIKPSVPKFVFKIFKPFFVMLKNMRKKGGEKEPMFGPKLTYHIGKTKGFFKKNYGLASMAIEELHYGGWEGLMFAFRRHMKKKRGEIPVDYARVNDYIPGLVTIGILSIDHLELIKPCLESVEKNLSQKYKVEILIGDTGTKEKKVWDFYKESRKKWGSIKTVKIGKYYFCRNYNDLFSKYAKGQYLILLNNDTIVKGNWIDELVDLLKDRQIGVVGGKLLYKDETIQHAGMEFKNGNALAVFAKEKKDLPEANFKAFVPVVTFACAAMRHDVYNRFRMDEGYREEAQDTDFCLRLRESGYKILYNPECEIYHLECSTRDWRKGERDRVLLKKQWGETIQNIIRKDEQRIRFIPDEYKDSIVVLRDDGIGDLLMGVSAFKKLKKKYPDRKIILATYARNVEMMAGFVIFDELIPIPNGQKYAPLPIPKDSKVIKLIDLEMDFSPMHGKPLEANKMPRHEVFSEILELGQPPFEFVPMPDYLEARKNVEELFKKENIDINQPFVVFNLIATNPARSWWEPYYPKLIKATEDAGFIPLMVGTKDSKYYQGEKVVDLVGKTKTIAEFIETVKLGKYVISTDSSAYHIAALARIPFLAIFTGGVKPEARVSHYEKYEALEPPKSLKCYPCWDEGCTDLSVRWKKDPCRLIIKPEEVIEKFKKLVKKYPINN